jgi:hypothetical protein
VQPRLRLKHLRDADGPAEVGEVGAAAHADVLADVNELAAASVGEGAGAAAEAGASFDQSDADTVRR